MEKLRRFCTAAVLTVVFTFSASAGDIQAPGITSLPSPQSSITGDISMPGAIATGDMPCPGAVALDPVTEAVWSLFQGLLSLF